MSLRDRDPVNMLVKGFFALLLFVVVVKSAVALLMDWWVTVGMASRIALLGFAFFVLVVEIHIGMWYFLDVGLLGVAGIIIGVFTHSGVDHSGRVVYESTTWDTLKRGLTRSQDNHIPVNDVFFQSDDAPAQPKLDRGKSMAVAGQTGKGKSNFVKDDIRRWDASESIFAHGLRDRGGKNEVRDHLDWYGFDLMTVSSSGSSYRWDPFLDLDKDVNQMISLAKSLYSAEQLKETGWSSADRMMLSAMLVYTSVEYGDFAHLGDALTTDLDEIFSVVDHVSNGEYLIHAIGDDEDDASVVKRRVVSGLTPLITSDICDPELPSVSIREFCENPDGRAFVLDNVTSDEFATGFWRIMMKSAIEIAYEAEGSQQFWIDELSSLPRIPNMKKLAKAGRKSGTRGVISIQNYQQLRETYGKDGAATIWSNSPNKIMFSAGDEETAEFFLRSIGKKEMVDYSRSTQNDDFAGVEDQITSKPVDKYPLTTGDLMRNQAGEALIVSDHGWWFGKIKEYIGHLD